MFDEKKNYNLNELHSDVIPLVGEIEAICRHDLLHSVLRNLPAARFAEFNVSKIISFFMFIKKIFSTKRGFFRALLRRAGCRAAKNCFKMGRFRSLSADFFGSFNVSTFIACLSRVNN